MIEEKDNEISRLIDDNENLRYKLQSKSFVSVKQSPITYSYWIHESASAMHLFNICI